jgi:transposase
VRGPDNTRPGRPQRGKVAAFADRLLKYRADVLRCAADATIPPDNNQAERDLRMAKLVDKVSGGFRTMTGAQAFATLRSTLSTARKQGHTAIAVLRHAFTPRSPDAAAARG